MRAGKHWTERNKKGCARLDTCIAKKYAARKPGELTPRTRWHLHCSSFSLLTLLCTPLRAGRMSKKKVAELQASFAAAIAPHIEPTWASVIAAVEAAEAEAGEDEEEDDDMDDDWLWGGPPTPPWPPSDEDEPPPPAAPPGAGLVASSA